MNHHATPSLRSSSIIDLIVRISLIAICVVVSGSILGCEGDEPVEISPCDEIDCPDGLRCDDATTECRCDDESCGLQRVCSDDATECLPAPHLRCEWGTTRTDDGTCRCDPDVCEDAGWSCTDGDRHCTPSDDGVCIDDASDWNLDAPAFADRSDEAGLADQNVEGVRLSTGDVTGNGFPDLLVRRPLAGADDFSDDGDRHSWLLENTGNGSFEDITQESGLLQRRYDDDGDRGRPAEVIALADIDNSGSLDAVTLATDNDGSDPEGAEVMFNDGTGHFELGPTSEPLHAAGEAVSRSGAAFVDIDNNGDLDLWIGNSGAPSSDNSRDRLLLGDGSGGFDDVTEQRGLDAESSTRADVLNDANGHTNTWAVAACDLDADGRPELLSSSYGRLPNHLWDAAEGDDGQTVFDNHSIESGYAFDHRKDWTDNESARCYCQHNPDADDCDDVPAPEIIQCNDETDAFRWNHNTDREPYRLGGNSGTTVCADLANNGRLDLLTTEIVHWDVGSSSDPTEILYNTGDDPVAFDRPGNDETGLERPRDGQIWDDGDITAAAFDIDNSGRLDILVASADYPGTRAHLFMQQPDGTFEYVPVDQGIDMPSAHGIAVADFDRSGSLDVVLGHSPNRCGSGDHCLDDPHVRLFENRVGDDNNWLQLELEGAEGTTNRSAIGARIYIGTDQHLQVAEIDGGHGHYGIQHDLVQHFGLGDACEATVVIQWPDAEATEEVYRLPAGQRYHVEQGEVPTVID